METYRFIRVVPLFHPVFILDGERGSAVTYLYANYAE